MFIFVHVFPTKSGHDMIFYGNSIHFPTFSSQKKKTDNSIIWSHDAWSAAFHQSAADLRRQGGGNAKEAAETAEALELLALAALPEERSAELGNGIV